MRGSVIAFLICAGAVIAGILDSTVLKWTVLKNNETGFPLGLAGALGMALIQWLWRKEDH